MESVSKEMEGEERRVGREGIRERDLKREEDEKSIHPETLRECRGAGAEGGQAQWKGRFDLLDWGGKEEGQPGPVSSDTPPASPRYIPF